MKQMINTNDYKRLMNFEIKVDCALCQLTGFTCSTDHFAPSDKVKEVYLQPNQLTEDEFNEVLIVLNSFNFLDSENRSES